MRIVLINAPYLDIYGDLNVGKNFSFPLGIGYIAAVLKKSGHDVFIMEPEIYRMKKSDIVDYLKDRSAEVIGITCATANFNGAKEIAHVIKEWKDIPVVLGGVHASSVPEQVIKSFPEFDIVVIGEGEYAMLEICDHIKNGKPLHEIKGIMFREKGATVINQPRPFIEDVDSLPFPARELVNLNNYRPQVHLDRGKKSATMITSRGCPARCTFCASFKTLGFRFRSHSPEYVLAEIEQLVNNYGIEHFIFVDDTFTIKPDRATKICNMIIEKGLKIDWYCFARVNTVTEQMLKVMKRAGCFSILYGIESSSPQILKNIKKGITPEQARFALRLSNKMGFKTITTFIFGNPGETRETIESSLKFAMELKPKISSFNKLVPFPGTEVYEQFYKERYKDGKNWNEFFPKGTVPLVQLEGLTSEDIQKATSLAYKRFYLRPTQIWRIITSIKTIGELKSYVRGAYGLFRQMIKWEKSKAIRYNDKGVFCLNNTDQN